MMLKQATRRAVRRSDLDPAIAPPVRPRFLSPTLRLGIAGALLLWAAFPPLDLPWLVWIAPVPWLWLVRQPRLPGRRPYVALWLAGCVHWLIMLQGIRLAHPALYAGWIALAGYIAVYLPLFVGLTRVAVHRLNVSLVLAAPVVWVGLELIRGYMITGFSMGLLAHTQAEFPLLIQVSDLAGGYTLSFAIMLVAACLARMIPLKVEGGREPGAGEMPATRRSISWWPLAPAAGVLAAVLLYGQWRLNQTPTGLSGPKADVALIQGSLDTVFEPIDGERMREIFDHYGELTSQAVAHRANLDLVVWPESSFVVADRVIEEPLAAPPGSSLSEDEFRTRLNAAQAEFRYMLAAEATRANASTADDQPGTLLLVNATTFAYGADDERIYNSALLADRNGNVLGRYYKMHAVMFGEYVPFASAIPWLNTITPISAGLSEGDGPAIFNVAGLKLSPSICFESTVPHLIRGHLSELARRGTPADLLVNVTNDGWFWGTSMLDLHFRCGVFRAVENRKPLIVAANTGLSGWIDGNGVIRERGPRRQPQVLLAEVQADGRASPYHTLGDWPAWLLAGCCAGLAGLGFWKRRE